VGKFLLVVIVFAAIVYGIFWLIERARAGAAPRRPPGAGRPAPRRPMAPDDDEDFLRDLRRRQRPRDEGSSPND
jgi:hypothetical protein